MPEQTGRLQPTERRLRKGITAMTIAGVVAGAILAMDRAKAIAVFDSASLGEITAMVSTMGQQLQQMQSLVTASEDLVDSLGELGDVNRFTVTLASIREEHGGWRVPDSDNDEAIAAGSKDPTVTSFLNENGPGGDGRPTNTGGGGEGNGTPTNEIEPSDPEEPNGNDNGAQPAWRNGLNGDDPYPSTEPGDLNPHREWVLRNWFVPPEEQRRTAAADGIARWRTFVRTSLAAEGFAQASQSQARSEAAAEAANGYMEALGDSDSIRADLQVLTYTAQSAVDAQWEANALAATLMQLEAAELMAKMPPALSAPERCVLFGDSC